ncbi:MAG: LysR substrate-binding domain-containing protein [Litoreibacter sp.]|nr:LysR substrate-binding domain-containing protein [Litoreibacter sp.]
MLPNLPMLRSLISLAETGSMTKSAEALNLTQSAISHQMRTLEEMLGYKLVTRQGRGIRLTAEARRYVMEVAPALDVIARASRTTETSGTLRLNVAPGFAASWLAPRISHFTVLHPSLTLTLNTPRGYGELGRREDDLYISFLTQDQRPLSAQLLYEVAFFPVAAPKLIAKSTPLPLGELLSFPLLHLDSKADWSKWSADAGGNTQPLPGIVFQDMQIMSAAARAGQGIALGDQLTNREDLLSGALMRAHAHTWDTPYAYYLIEGDTPPSKAKSAFTDWVLAQF